MQTAFDNYTLRILREDDLEGYFHLIDQNRPRLEDFFAGTVAMTKTLEDTEKHIADAISKYEKRNYFPFVITDDASGKIIGSIQVKSLDWAIPKAELGYYIDAEYSGKGIITKSTALVIAFCFHELKINKLFIRTYEGNVASRRVAEKNGFVLEGFLRCDYKTTSGTLVDLMYFGLLNPALLIPT